MKPYTYILLRMSHIRGHFWTFLIYFKNSYQALFWRRVILLNFNMIKGEKNLKILFILDFQQKIEEIENLV
jgi:hypothetical protein